MTPADLAVVEAVTGARWEVSEALLRHWADTQDPPFVSVGDAWFTTAHEDAALQLLPSVPSNAIERFRRAVMKVFVASPAPAAVTLETMLEGGDRPSTVSATLRSGLMETLVLLGVHPQLLSRPDRQVASVCVRELMSAAFSDQSAKRLSVVVPFFPQLAESSPEVFLTSLEAALSDHPDLVMALFTDQEDARETQIFRRPTLHTHLLWALETLAWSPDYFAQAIEFLSQLAHLDPGGRLANRPDRSLQEILMPWVSHTMAAVAERAGALRTMAKRHPDVAWKVLMAIWPSNHASSLIPRRPEFRDWSPDRNVRIDELVNRLQVSAELAPELARGKPSRWAELVPRIHFMPADLAQALRDQLEDSTTLITDQAEQRSLRRTLEEIARRHREHPSADWAMTADALAQLESIAKQLVADEPELEYVDLFDWEADRRAATGRRAGGPPPRGGRPGKRVGPPTKSLIEQLEDERNEAAIVISGYTEEQLTALAQRAKVPPLLGRALGLVPGAPNEAQMLRWLSKSGPLVGVATAWVASWSTGVTTDEIRRVLANEALSEGAAQARLNFLTSCTPTPALAEVLENNPADAEVYWEDVHPHALRGEMPHDPVPHLVRAGRLWAATEVLSLELHGPIDRDRAIELASQAREILDAFLGPESPPVDKPFMSASYEIGKLLAHVSEHDPAAPMARYEYGLNQILSDDRRPVALFSLLAGDPNEYIALFNAAFAARTELDPSQQRASMRNAWSVLDDFDRIPGSREDGSIDEEALRGWVRSVRSAHAASELEALGDELVGRILASTHGRGKHTIPPPEVCNVFDEYGNDRIATGFIVARINSVGVTTRGLHDGGRQERQLAERYFELSAQSRAEWPRMSRALRSIAEDMERSAQREDDEAERRGFGV